SRFAFRTCSGQCAAAGPAGGAHRPQFLCTGIAAASVVTVCRPTRHRHAGSSARQSRGALLPAGRCRRLAAAGIADCGRWPIRDCARAASRLCSPDDSKLTRASRVWLRIPARWVNRRKPVDSGNQWAPDEYRTAHWSRRVVGGSRRATQLARRTAVPGRIRVAGHHGHRIVPKQIASRPLTVCVRRCNNSRMAEARSIVTGASLALAVICASWAVYATKHHAPAAGGPQAQQARPRGPGGGGNADAVPVLTASAESRQINVGIEAIGNAIANESVTITSKSTNIVTAIRFTDGQSVTAGQVLVELDRAGAEADLAAAAATFAESQSLFNRSRELMSTQALSKSSYEQLEATMKSNQARVDASRARLADTYIRAPFTGRVG